MEIIATRGVYFYICLVKIWTPIRQQVVRGDMITITFLNDKLKAFIAEYELVNADINKSKVDGFS